MKKIEIKDFEVFIESKLEIEELRNNINDFFKENSSVYSVLGFDIYKYSKYKTLEQSLIPYVFKSLYMGTIDHCLKYEKYIYQNYSKKNDFVERLIDTGDGGFQIFDNPIEAFVFATYFQANLKRFNSFGTAKNIREITGEITLRYALTTDFLFKFEDNCYGPAIINNARIMSKDKLNRFLIDDLSIKWFDKNVKGIENLQSLDIEDFKKIDYFSKYQRRPSLIFSIKDEHGVVLNADLLRIGEIEAKGDPFSVYSFHCQIKLHSPTEPGFNRYIVTLGNLNSTGLD